MNLVIDGHFSLGGYWWQIHASKRSLISVCKKRGSVFHWYLQCFMIIFIKKSLPHRAPLSVFPPKARVSNQEWQVSTGKRPGFYVFFPKTCMFREKLTEAARIPTYIDPPHHRMERLHSIQPHTKGFRTTDFQSSGIFRLLSSRQIWQNQGRRFHPEMILNLVASKSAAPSGPRLPGEMIIRWREGKCCSKQHNICHLYHKKACDLSWDRRIIGF